MKTIRWNDLPAGEVYDAAAKGVHVRELITRRDGAPTFAMRHFTVEPGGHTPHHLHPWEHEVFILEGRGELTCGEKIVALEPGMAVYVPVNAPHQFRAGGDGLKFLCMIPSNEVCATVKPTLVSGAEPAKR